MRRVRPRVWLWLRTGHQSGRFARRSLSSTSNSKPWGRTQLDGRCSRFGGGVPSSRERESEFLGSVDEFQITYILPAKDAKASIPTNRRVPKALALVESYSVDTEVRFPLATRYIGVLSVRELLASSLPGLEVIHKPAALRRGARREPISAHRQSKRKKQQGQESDLLHDSSVSCAKCCCAGRSRISSLLPCQSPCNPAVPRRG